MRPPAVLLVCHANRCRSPIAAVLLRRLLAGQPDAVGWRVESAGLHAVPDLPATQWVCQVADEAGLDLSRHRSRSVDDLKLDDFDLILTMEEIQAEALAAEYPALAVRIRPFSSLVGLRANVADPTLDGGLEAHRALLRLLERYLKAGLPRLLQDVQPHGKAG